MIHSLSNASVGSIDAKPYRPHKSTRSAARERSIYGDLLYCENSEQCEVICWAWSNLDAKSKLSVPISPVQISHTYEII